MLRSFGVERHVKNTSFKKVFEFFAEMTALRQRCAPRFVSTCNCSFRNDAEDDPDGYVGRVRAGILAQVGAMSVWKNTWRKPRDRISEEVKAKIKTGYHLRGIRKVRERRRLGKNRRSGSRRRHHVQPPVPVIAGNACQSVIYLLQYMWPVSFGYTVRSSTT